MGGGMDFAAFQAAAPDAVEALRALSKSAGALGLDPALAELVKVRASQINGCVFCVALHLDWARKAGVAADKLDLVAVWPEAVVFDARERAALAWTEAVTRAAPAEAVDAAREALSAHFNETEILGLTVAVATINAWNRIAGPLRFPAR